VSTTKPENNKMRFDLQIIASWIEPGSRVIDLGCGEGDLLKFLIHHKGATGTGIEHNESKAAQCIEKGLSVLQGDINEEVLDYPDNSFDYVIMSQTLQQVYEPDTLIRSMLRIGKRGIVSFPNFSHWGCRLQLLLSGYAPVTQQLPYEWYNTPNTHLCTLSDFEDLCERLNVRILQSRVVNYAQQSNVITRMYPSLLGEIAIYHITRG